MTFIIYIAYFFTVPTLRRRWYMDDYRYCRISFLCFVIFHPL